MYISNTIPYLLFFAFCFFLSLLFNTYYSHNVISKPINIFSVYSIFLISIFFIGCRGYVAADWLYYKPYFDDAPTLFSKSEELLHFIHNSNYEIGYCIYTIITKSVFPDYLFFQLLSFTIDIIILHYFFKYYCKRYYFLCWVFFWIFQGFVFEIITLRNTKSILIFLISTKYIVTKKPLKYIALNVLALCFHTSALLTLPFYYICQLKRRKIVELSLFIIGNIFFILNIEWLKPLLLQFVGVFSGRLGAMLSIYMNSDFFSSARGVSIGYLERIFSFVFLYKYSDELIDDNNENKLFWYAFIIFSYIYLFCSEMHIILERVPNLFVFAYWILYPQIYGKLKRERKYIFLIVLFVYGILRNMMLLNQKWSFYDNFIFGAVDEHIRRLKYTY